MDEFLAYRRGYNIPEYHCSICGVRYRLDFGPDFGLDAELCSNMCHKIYCMNEDTKNLKEEIEKLKDFQNMVLDFFGNEKFK